MGLRVCEIVQQIEYLPGYPDNWKEQLEENLNSNDKIEHWVYIIHDKDTDENGNLKKPHIHLILKLNDSYEPSTIGGYVGVSKNYVNKIHQKRPAGKRMVSDIGGAISYLTHRNAPEKHQYDDKEVIAQPGFKWKEIRAESEAWHAQNKSFRKVLAKIEEGEIRPYNLMEYISMRMYMDHKTDFEKAFEYRQTKIKSCADREIEVIYIYGEPGAGKTTLAKQICEKRGLSYCLSGSSRDPVQDYGGQDALILDDLRPESFSLSDLLKMLDNNSASSVSARYRDRWLEVKLIIITTVLTIEDFHTSYENPSEPIEQLMRRCKEMIMLTKTHKSLYIYNDNKQSYQLIGEGKNNIPAQFATENSLQIEVRSGNCTRIKQWEVIKMNDTNSLSHTSWNCKYHIVFAPKYRRKVFYGQKRKEIGEILRKLCEWKKVNIIEAEVCPDHIHMLVEIPPKYSVSSFMGYLKGKSSLMIYEKYPELKYKYRNREFWCRGYYVDTAGKNAKKIEEYIKHQLDEDKAGEQMTMPNF